MKIGIITIGNELLNGMRIDTNSSWIGESVQPAGGNVVWKASVVDDKNQIIHVLNSISDNIDVIIMTGGLGPTHDDITLKVLSDYFKTELEFDNHYWEILKKRYRSLNKKNTKSNRSQAMKPVDALTIDNSIGTARGVHFKNKKFNLFALPGVPSEMKGMMNSYILPFIYKRSKTKIHYKLLRTTGITESSLFEMLKDKISSNKKIELAFLPRFTGVDIRISSHREIDLDNFHSDLFSMLSKYIYADSSKDIENIIGDLLKEKKLTLSTAESCTGGLIADRLTNIPGSSAFFQGGIIAYSNDVKISDLGVSEKILNKKGAVSSDVAKDMAKGIRQKYNTNIGLSTTGIAGPEGGSIDKPVGLVYIGLSTEDREESFKFNFSISRKKNKLMFSQGALNILREYLLPL